MKTVVKLVLIIAVSSLLFGDEKKDNTPAATPPSAEIQTAESAKTEADSKNAPPVKPAELPTAAPLKGLEWIKGDPVTIEPNNIYVVEFWATWCGPCKATIPHLTEIQKKYKDKGLMVVGVSSPSEYPNESIKTVESFVKQMGDKMDYTIGFDVQGFVQKNYMNAFSIQGIPHAFIIDRNGKIAWHGHPAEDMDIVLELVVQGIFDPVMYAKGKADAEALLRQCMAWYTDYFQKIQTDGLSDEVKQIGDKFIEKAPVDGLDAFAWRILNQVKEADRDLEAALKAAEKAKQLTEGREPSIMNTYALALFENGKIAEAVKAQEKVIELAKDYPQAQKQIQETLEKYKAAMNQKNP